MRSQGGKARAALIVVFALLTTAAAITMPASAATSHPSDLQSSIDSFRPSAVKAGDAVSSICPDLRAQHPDAAARPGAFYGIPLAVKVTNGVFKVGNAVQAASVNATICGYLALPATSADTSPTSAPGCPGCSISFAGSEANIYNAVALPLTVSVTQALIAMVHQQVASNGGVVLDLSAPLSANVALPQLGVQCGLPLTAQLTTDPAKGGQAITGPITSAIAQGVSENLTVPAIQPTTTCPATLAVPFERTAGLPSAPGQATFTAPVQLYLSLLGDAR